MGRGAGVGSGGARAFTIIAEDAPPLSLPKPRLHIVRLLRRETADLVFFAVCHMDVPGGIDRTTLWAIEARGGAGSILVAFGEISGESRDHPRVVRPIATRNGRAK